MTTPAPVTAKPGEVKRDDAPIPAGWFWQEIDGEMTIPRFATKEECAKHFETWLGRPVYVPGELEQPPADPCEKLEWLVVDTCNKALGPVVIAAFDTKPAAIHYATGDRALTVIHRTDYSKERP